MYDFVSFKTLDHTYACLGSLGQVWEIIIAGKMLSFEQYSCCIYATGEDDSLV